MTNPTPPPVEQWPWYQAEHIRRQTEALESIRASCIGIVVMLSLIVVAGFFGLAAG